MQVKQHQKYLYHYHLGFRRTIYWSFGRVHPVGCHLVWFSGRCHCRRHRRHCGDAAPATIAAVRSSDAYGVRTFDCRCCQFPANNNHWPPNYFAPSPIPISYPSSCSCAATIVPAHSGAPGAGGSRWPIDARSAKVRAVEMDERLAPGRANDPTDAQFCHSIDGVAWMRCCWWWCACGCCWCRRSRRAPKCRQSKNF